VTDRLRVHWDFDDLDASERRLRAALAEEGSDEGRAEVLTQLARVDGLRGDFDAGESLIEEAEGLAGASAVARTRIDLERGRLRRSSGDREAALPLFESAYSRAGDAGMWFLAADAAHMVALAAPDRNAFVEWTQRGIELAEAHAEAAYWAGPLLNNLGWEHYEAGELDEALDAFERALRARERNPTDGDGIALARYAVGKALRSLGRAEEAIPLLEQAVAWADGEGKPDGWFHEELAEEYVAAGRDAEARTHARQALPLLEADDPSFAEDEARATRLRVLAGIDADTAD
jgi:tetratricopeptide (TPR) repeat protein